MMETSSSEGRLRITPEVVDGDDLAAYADAVATRVRLSREEGTDVAPAEAEAYRG